jgi:hypothetical protein
MKKLLVGLAPVQFLARFAMAGQPMPLSDAQMDKVTAGYTLAEFLDLSWAKSLCFPPCIFTGGIQSPLAPFDKIADVHLVVHFIYPGPPTYTGQ